MYLSSLAAVFVALSSRPGGNVVKGLYGLYVLTREGCRHAVYLYRTRQTNSVHRVAVLNHASYLFLDKIR